MNKLSCSEAVEHCCKAADGSFIQTLDEMTFERGIWSAALYGHVDRVKKLLEHPGVEVDQKAKYGYTPLHFAARNGHLPVCKFLVERGADVNAPTTSGNNTPLHKACFAGHYDVVAYLLSQNADPTLVEADGKTALHKAAEGNHQAIYDLIAEKHPSLETVPDKRGRCPCDYGKQ